MTRKRIGILALQGAFEAHAKIIQSLGAETILIRQPEELANLDGLIIPGGESTTFLRHLERDDFYQKLSAFVSSTPTFGTCAGAILLAKKVTNPDQTSLSAMNIEIERNAYGRQNDSAILVAETDIQGGPIEMVFIRAPRITNIGPNVKVLARRDNAPVLVRENHLLAATFHPELSLDSRVHELFLSIVSGASR